MLNKKFIDCVDSHTGGEPTRLVVGGLPVIKGKNIKNKSRYFSKNLDHFRSILTGEPRGHAPMHASVYINTKSKKSDFGLILMSALGYLDMCGHALIGSVTSLIKTKYLSLENKKNIFKIETCAGIIKAKVNFKNNALKSISFINEKSFALKKKIKINIPKYGNVYVHLAYGGLWYMIVDTKDLDIKINKKNLNKLIFLGKQIRKIINIKISKIKFNRKVPKKIPQTLFFEKINNKTAKNFVTSDELGFDRSPCGTGSCARLALLLQQGKIKKNQEYLQKSILNTSFKTRIIDISNNGDIIPEITGSAHITGLNRIFVDPKDKIKNGFFW